jgi:type I restriction enzyme S subunit
LICTRNGSKRLIGKSAYITKENAGHTFGVFMTIFRSKYWKFVSYVFNSDVFMQQAGLYLTSTINQLTVNNLDNIIIALPPTEEQKTIVEHLNRKTTEIDKHIKKIKRRILLLEEYKKSLIYNTVTGKIKI